MVRYSKPVKNNQDLINKWKEQGLLIPDSEKVHHYLSTICYYRFSAYTIPFQEQNTGADDSLVFKPHVSFDTILELYVFDRKLRLLVLDAIERIEVAVRTQICNVLCSHSDDPFWYTKQVYFKPEEYDHDRLLEKIKKQLEDENKRLKRDLEMLDKRKSLTEEERNLRKENICKENFIRHYLTKYGDPKLPPSWMMTEMLTFGELSRLYSGLNTLRYDEKPRKTCREQISRFFGLNSNVFASWLRFLSSVRNVCAHHNRLWNRVYGDSPKMPKSTKTLWIAKEQNQKSSSLSYAKRTYILLVILQVLLYTISPNSTWAKRLKKLMEAYPDVPKKQMGMPEEWYMDPFWEKALSEKKNEYGTDDAKDVLQ